MGCTKLQVSGRDEWDGLGWGERSHKKVDDC